MGGFEFVLGARPALMGTPGYTQLSVSTYAWVVGSHSMLNCDL